MYQSVRIVLINTSHPGNIGSAARAMKTMGLNALYLVSPKTFPHQKAIEMASGATDVLENAIVTDHLDQAIADCTLILGTSARMRTIPWPVLFPKELKTKLSSHYSQEKIAILFGCEQHGLNNEELQRCHYHIQIPANPEYASLNLAQAVQIIAYELYEAKHDIIKQWDFPAANHDQMQQFYNHLESLLIQIDFLKPKAPRQLMTRLKRLFNRSKPDQMEMNILRGILSATEKALSK